MSIRRPHIQSAASVCSVRVRTGSVSTSNGGMAEEDIYHMDRADNAIKIGGLWIVYDGSSTNPSGSPYMKEITGKYQIDDRIPPSQSVTKKISLI